MSSFTPASRPDVHVHNPQQPTPREMYTVQVYKHITAATILLFSSVTISLMYAQIASLETWLMARIGLYVGIVISIGVLLHLVRYCLGPELPGQGSRAARPVPVVSQPPPPPAQNTTNKSDQRRIVEAARALNRSTGTPSWSSRSTASNATPALLIKNEESNEVRTLALLLASEGQLRKRRIVFELKMMSYEAYRVATDRLVELGILAADKGRPSQDALTRRVWIEQADGKQDELLLGDDDQDET